MVDEIQVKEIAFNNKIIELSSSQILDGLTIKEIESLFSKTLNVLKCSCIIDSKSEVLKKEINILMENNKELKLDLETYLATLHK